MEVFVPVLSTLPCVPKGLDDGKDGETRRVCKI